MGEIRQHWPEVRVAMGHRTGKLAIGEISLLIAVASPHRDESFAAGRYAIERLKEIVPIWKKKYGKMAPNGKGRRPVPGIPVKKRILPLLWKRTLDPGSSQSKKSYARLFIILSQFR